MRGRLPSLCRACLCSVLLAGLCLPAPACASGAGPQAPLPTTSAAFPAPFDPAPSSRFVVSKEPGYGAPQAALRKLLSQEKKAGVANHFCVVGYRFGPGQAHAWVHWKEQQRMLLWRGGVDEQTRADGLIGTQRDLKLGQDTVATVNDINGSTYLVTRAWWQAVADDCTAHGEQVTLAPPPGARRPGAVRAPAGASAAGR